MIQPHLVLPLSMGQLCNRELKASMLATIGFQPDATVSSYLDQSISLHYSANGVNHEIPYFFNKIKISFACSGIFKSFVSKTNKLKIR